MADQKGDLSSVVAKTGFIFTLEAMSVAIIAPMITLDFNRLTN